MKRILFLLIVSCGIMAAQTLQPPVKTSSVTIPGAPSGSYVKADGSGAGTPSVLPTGCTGSSGGNVNCSGTGTFGSVAADTTISAPNINGLITPIGLDPTGTNDNSAAFQLAVTASHNTGACVSIPPGIYILLTPVTFAGGECISGYNGSKGAQGVTLKPTTAAFVTSAPLSQLQNVAIHDFNIQGGTNPIDLGEFHFITIYNMTFQDYTGWAISTVRGERHELSNIFCFHSTVSAQGCLSLGDFNNSIFASTYTAASFNDPWWDKSLVMDIVDQGVSATISDQYTIWSNAGASGYQAGSVNNSIFQNITSRIAGQTAQVWMYSVFNSEFHNLITDGDGTSASPIPVVFNVPGTFQDSTLDQSSPAYAGTNYFTTGAFFGQFNNSHISRSYMLGNNTTSYGIVFASNYGNTGSIDSYTGAIYNQSANSYWKNDVSVTGSNVTANNAAWGQNIHDAGNLGVAVTLAGPDGGNDSAAATSSFTVTHNAGGGTGKQTFAVTPRGPQAPQGILNLTPISSDASPVNGDVWTTSVGLFAYVNGVTQGPFLAGSGYCQVSGGSNCTFTGAPITPQGSNTAPGLQIGSSGYGLSNYSGNQIDVLLAGALGVEMLPNSLRLVNGSYYTNWVNGTLTANQTFTTPNASSNSVQPQSSATSNQWVQYVDSSGVQHLSQPAFSNISGSPSTTQVPFQSLTTTGTNGAATLSGGVLNIPQYSGGSIGAASYYLSPWPGNAASGAESTVIYQVGFVTPPGGVTISNGIMTVSDVADATYYWGLAITDPSGNVVCSTAAFHVPAPNTLNPQACTQTMPITLAGETMYHFLWTQSSASATGKLTGGVYPGYANPGYNVGSSGCTNTAGVISCSGFTPSTAFIAMTATYMPSFWLY